MSMDAVLKQLESKIEEMVDAYRSAVEREAELTARVEELEGQVASEGELGDRLATLEKQREELAERLEKILALIDGTLKEA